MRLAGFYRLLLIVAGILSFASHCDAAIDDVRAAAVGIRKLSGKRLTLYTDLSGKEIDQLPAVFEQAFSQWCKYFHVKESDYANWHMTGFLMKDKAGFVEAGLLPDKLPPFEHGFSWDHVLWLYEQPSHYYRRHLLLHEGTHGFMNTVLGHCGPPWYMEGIAEYLATHQWLDGQLTLSYMPRSREEVPQWGRIRIIQDAVAQRKALKLPQVLDYPDAKRSETDFYAWCWALATLLDHHPRYQERFRQLFQFVRDPEFNERFHKLYAADWQELREEWQLMVANMEYGYDVARCAIDFTPGTLSPRPLGEGQDKKGSPRPLGEGQGVRATATVTVAANCGWQNTGLQLVAGVKYRLTATGRYQVANKPQIWWCEPGGVSIRYYRGQPLGILLAAVRPDHPAPDSTSALLRPTVVGLGVTLRPAETGTLFLKINDSPAELHDNAGELKVDVQRE